MDKRLLRARLHGDKITTDALTNSFKPTAAVPARIFEDLLLIDSVCGGHSYYLRSLDLSRVKATHESIFNRAFTLSALSSIVDVIH
jgi:hypothetical protein